MRRRRIPEVMDGRDVKECDHAHALRSLNRVNRMLGVDRRLGRSVARFGVADPSVLDLGCGGGGFLAYLSTRAGPSISIGLDRSSFALQCARAWHPDGIRWISADARFLPFADRAFDVVTCSLFLHHFEPAEVATILREAARVARHGIVVGDLVRSRMAMVVTWLATRAMSRSWIVHVDAVRSVHAAFQVNELAALARKAGLVDAVVQRRFPFRLVLTWKKS